jgi:hypothetical protein
LTRLKEVCGCEAGDVPCPPGGAAFLSAQVLLDDCYATHEGSSSLPAAEFLGIPTFLNASLPVYSVQAEVLQSVVKRNNDIGESESVAGGLEISSMKRKCEGTKGVERAQLVYGKHQHIIELFNRARHSSPWSSCSASIVQLLASGVLEPPNQRPSS